jgi:hypothetical protein
MKIMLFLHGTILMHAAGQGVSRQERVEQVRAGEASVRNYAAYLPIGGAAAKVQAWHRHGAEIVYLSSQKARAILLSDRQVLARHGFPEGGFEFRQGIERYQDVVERILPDILIEDDCESIGGAPEIIHPHLPLELQERITSIVVAEFGGIDHLPDDPTALQAF